MRFKAKSARPTGVRRWSWSADGNLGPPKSNAAFVVVQKIGPESLDWPKGLSSRRGQRRIGDGLVDRKPGRTGAERLWPRSGYLGDTKVLDFECWDWWNSAVHQVGAICELSIWC